MEKEKIDNIVSLYNEYKNIKKVGELTSIPWQTVYWNLQKRGIICIGDKEKYGSNKDRFACIGEKYIQSIFGDKAKNQNEKKFQSKFDFLISDLKVECKSSKFSQKNKKWAFSFKRQRKVADFYIALCFDSNGNSVLYNLLIPDFMIRDNLQQISIGQDIMKSKWSNFIVTKEQLLKSF